MLKIYKFKVYKPFCVLKSIACTGITGDFAKGHLSHCKRCPFTVQKSLFYELKEHLLHALL